MSHPTPDTLALVALGEEVGAEELEHLNGCQTCLTEVGALRQVVAIGRSLGPEDELADPSARVWERIAAEAHGDRVTAPLGSSVLLEQPANRPTPGSEPLGDGSADELAARRRTKRGPRRWSTVAVAAASALVLGLGGGYALKGLSDSGSGSDVVTQAQLNALPAWPGANGKAVLEDGANGQRTLVVSVEMPSDEPVDGTLEVWMSDTRAREMVAMGTMSGSSARLPVPAGFDLAAHPIIDVSLEPQGDTDPHHSDESVVRGRLNV